MFGLSTSENSSETKIPKAHLNILKNSKKSYEEESSSVPTEKERPIKGLSKEPIEFDLFTIPMSENTEANLQEQREFEIWWRNTTGRRAIVVSGVEFKGTLEYRGK